MTESKICTCPSGDGSLVHPCPAHPAVEQAGEDERAAKPGLFCRDCGSRLMVRGVCSIYCPNCVKAQARAALAQPSPDAPYADDIAADLERSDWTPEDALRWYAAGKHFDTVNGRTRIIDTGAVASNALKHLSLPYLEMKGDAELTELREAMAQPSPVRSSLLINGYQLRAALDFIAPDGTAEQLESEACIEWRQQDADFLEAGLYAFCAEYPEEGGVLLDEEPTTAQPSPLQSEQAEAERPEMSPERAAYFMRRFKSEEKLLGPNEQAAVDYVLSLLAQHESIVGALRAELESERNRVNIYVNNNGIRQDNERLRAELRAALARVAEQQTEIEWLKNPKALAETVHADAQEAVKLQRLLMDSHTACRPAGEGLMGWAHAALSAQAQHSVPEGWKPVPIEPLLNMMSDKDHDTRIMAERQLLSILAAAPGNSVPQAWLDVQAERRRQITAEGWTPEHDDEHDNGELAAAGAAYALHAADHLNPYSQGDGGDEAPSCWPWHDGIAGRGEGPEKTEPAWWKPSTPRRDLVKACALGLAEIERLDRVAASQGGPSDA